MNTCTLLGGGSSGPTNEAERRIEVMGTGVRKETEARAKKMKKSEVGITGSLVAFCKAKYYLSSAFC